MTTNYLSSCNREGGDGGYHTHAAIFSCKAGTLVVCLFPETAESRLPTPHSLLIRTA